MKKFPVIETILIVIGTLLYFFANIQRVAVPGAIFDVLQQDLATTAEAITALSTVFMYIYAFTQLIIGILVTRFGGFRVISISAIVFFTGCLLFPISKSLPFLYISRLLIGIGSAGFYLSLIDETKNIVSSKNFGFILSIMLLIGYLGGIVANAPLVICVNKMGWRETFLLTGIVIAILSILFILINLKAKHKKINKNIKLDLSLFKNVLKIKNNRNLYISTGLNYGIYYVLLAITGKKFLEDFCQISTINAAIFLSAMGALYAISGSVLAYISKLWYYKKSFFIRLATLNTLIVSLITLICIVFNIKTILIAFLFCLIPVFSNLSPMAVPLLHDYNEDKNASTSVSMMTCIYYLSVGILGSLCGYLLDLFTPVTIITGQNLIYSNKSYIAIFTVMTILSIIAFAKSFNIPETKTTIKLIRWYHTD